MDFVQFLTKTEVHEYTDFVYDSEIFKIKSFLPVLPS